MVMRQAVASQPCEVHLSQQPSELAEGSGVSPERAVGMSVTTPHRAELSRLLKIEGCTQSSLTGVLLNSGRVGVDAGDHLAGLGDGPGPDGGWSLRGGLPL